jgi:hypothetical protein
VAVYNGEIVVFNKTVDGWYHGHVRTWSQLKAEGKAGQCIRNVLIKNGLVNSVGKIK